MNAKHVQALVLDWAGTTVDHGSRAPALVFQEIFRRRGIEITIAQAREPMGMAKRDHITAITCMPEIATTWKAKYGRACGGTDIDAMYQEFLPLQKSVLADHAGVIPGVAGVIQECRQRGLKIGSTTGYTRELMEVVAPLAREQGYAPDCILCVEDAPRGRPAPYLLLEAAIHLDVYPLSTVVNIDDTPVGIEAGRHAGCWSVGVTRTGNCVGLSLSEVEALSTADRQAVIAQAAQRLTGAGAHFTVESVAEILPVLEAINARLAAGAHPDLA